MTPEELFRQRKWLFFVGMKALITRGGKILALSSGPAELSSTKRRRVFWDLPGGKVEWGESVAETLQREVAEELGVRKGSLHVRDVFEASVSKIRISHGIRIPLILVTFLCELSGVQSKFTLSDEHASYRWIDIDAAKRLLSSKFNASFIRKLDSIRNVH